MGLEVTGRARVGFEDNVASPCEKTISDEDSAAFTLRKGTALSQGGFTLFRFFVITKVPFFPNQFSNFSMKKDPEKLWIKCRLSFCRFQHWTSLSHLLACQLQETRGLGRLQKLFGPLTKALADNPSWAGHFLACTLQGGQSNQPLAILSVVTFVTLLYCSCHLVFQGLLFNMLFFPNNSRWRFLKSSCYSKPSVFHFPQAFESNQWNT